VQGSGLVILFIAIAAAVALALAFGAPRRKRARMQPRRTSAVDAETALTRSRQQAEVERRSRWPQRLRELPFPFEVVAGAQAEAAYESARLKGETEGFTPLIITPDSNLLPGVSHERLTTEAQRILATAPQVDEFFAELRAGLFAHDDDALRQLAEAEAFAVAEPVSEWQQVGNRMSTVEDMAGHRPPFPPIEQAAIVRIPTPRSWEIPAYTLYGGWTSCPDSAQMVAVARHWHEIYGADICAIGKQTLEFRVARPPADQHAALALMREHLLFCDEGLGDLIDTPVMFRDAVAQLRGQRYWLFWWD
jgi:hypothetical protein